LCEVGERRLDLANSAGAEDFEWETHMREIRFWSTIAAATLMLTSTAGWINYKRGT